MKTEQVAIAEVTPLERNPRRHSETQLKELRRSLQKFGQYRPLVVDEDGMILAGNGLHAAMSAEGFEKVTVYRATGLSEHDKNRLILADNRTAELGKDDYDVIQAMLAELDDFEVPGYDPEIIQELVMDADSIIEQAANYGALDDDEIERLRGRSEDTRRDREAAQETVGKPADMTTPPGPTERPEGLPDDVEVCPTCGRGW